MSSQRVGLILKLHCFDFLWIIRESNLRSRACGDSRSARLRDNCEQVVHSLVSVVQTGCAAVRCGAWRCRTMPSSTTKLWTQRATVHAVASNIPHRITYHAASHGTAAHRSRCERTFSLKLHALICCRIIVQQVVQQFLHNK